MPVSASAVHFMMFSAVWRSEDETQTAPKDELAEYLAIPQIKYKTEEDALEWWKVHARDFPNVAVMARKYLGCPASSASVERLFSQVGMAYSAKRKRAGASTLESIMFARSNLPTPVKCRRSSNARLITL